jgi:hypothetical protein
MCFIPVNFSPADISGLIYQRRWFPIQKFAPEFQKSTDTLPWHINHRMPYPQKFAHSRPFLKRPFIIRNPGRILKLFHTLSSLWNTLQKHSQNL